jgi:hypothetical protein
MTILKAIVGYIVPVILGYCLGLIKKRRITEKEQNEALKCLLQNSLTNIFYVYNEIGEIPDYALKNWLNLMKPYEALDGDDYIHELDKIIKKMPVKATGIIK